MAAALRSYAIIFLQGFGRSKSSSLHQELQLAQENGSSSKILRDHLCKALVAPRAPACFKSSQDPIAVKYRHLSEPFRDEPSIISRYRKVMEGVDRKKGGGM